MSEASEFAHRLSAKRTSAGWSAKCPAHDDRTASLSISEGKDDSLLLYCHAGCNFDAILKAAGVEPKKPNGHDTRRKLREVAAYNYHNARGRLVFQVVRYEPKSFKQRRAQTAAAAGSGK
jgi:putative DNA primase/helicase